MRIKKELNPKIFISYSHDDIDFAKKFSNRLKEDGYDLWIDVDDIRANEQFSKEIELGIYKSAIFVSLISESYITKQFCGEEIECARHYNKELIPLHIEKVIIPPGSGFVLSFSKSQLGYGKDIVTEEDFEALYKGFLEAIELFVKKGNRGRFKVKNNIDFEVLRNNFEQLSFGGYVIDEIYTELFPAITVDGGTKAGADDTSLEAKKTLISSDDNNKALIDYIEDHSKSHIFIKGEGGSGKTVALKRIFEDFYAKEIPTLYVPLNKVGFSNTDRDALKKYVSENACGKAGWSNIKQLALDDNYTPRVVLMLDGLNEVTGDDVMDEVIRQISNMMQWSNLQIIITSRIDCTEQFSDKLKIKSVNLEPISKEKIRTHLNSKGVDMVKNKQLLHLLSNPMMLALYTETKMNSEYLNQIKKSSWDLDYFRIKITENPDTAVKIIWNYVISQLYKASKQSISSTETIKNFVTTELFLPFLGYSLIRDSERISVDFAEFRGMMFNFQETECFETYKKNRAEDLKFQMRATYKISHYESVDFIKITTNQLHFINESDRKLEFAHQIFRDFFAALFISKQIESLASDYGEKEYSYDVVANQIYSKDIIDYLVDILGETEGRPQKGSEGIAFPGKEKRLSPSAFSVAEKALLYFKGMEGKAPQTGVANLFEIMKTGRKLNLSNCDFSELDLRLCDLSGVLFVDWYKDETYPCSFDEAYIDIESFISPGHNVNVSAVHVHGDRIYSGDVNGIVKIWTLDSDYPLLSHAVTAGEPVIDMVYSSAKGILGVLTSYRLYSFDAESETVEVLCETHNYYKYIKVDGNGDFLVSTDVEPLTWSDVHGNLKCEEMPFKATCGCVAKNPVRDEYLVGVLYNNAFLFRCENDSEYAVSKRIDLHNVHAFINDVCYSPDGTKFIVATNKTVSEFSSGSLMLRHRIDLEGSVSSVEYFDDKIAVATGSGIVILDKDFSVKKRYKGKKVCTNVSVLLDNDRMFICSAKNKIFEMTNDFTVRRARKVSIGSHICIGNHGKGESCFILINDGNKNETGYRYDFETAELNELTYNYEIVTESYDTDDYPYEIVRKGNTVLFTNKENVNDKKEFIFYPNINIFDCSFRNIKGNIREAENLDFVIMYGGIV